MDDNEWRLFLSKESLKFSAAHMTVFPDGTKEALHGHNYQVSLTIDLRESSFERVISFAQFKKALRPLCDTWDEKILIATKNPHLKHREIEEGVEVILCGKRYVFPRDEIVLLELDNITTESLAKELCLRLVEKLRDSLSTPAPKGLPLMSAIAGVELRIDESNGQGASFRTRIGHTRMGE